MPEEKRDYRELVNVEDEITARIFSAGPFDCSGCDRPLGEEKILVENGKYYCSDCRKKKDIIDNL